MKFKLYKDKLIVDKDSLEDQAFVDLLEEGLKYLLYVFFAKDLSDDNPLVDIPFDEKEDEARLRAFGSSTYGIPESVQPLVDKALVAYDRLVTEHQREMYTYEKKMDQFGFLLKKTTPRIEKNVHAQSGFVSFTTNIDIINAILKDITNIIQAKASLMSLHIQGSLPKHLRGKLSPLTKGKLKVS